MGLLLLAGACAEETVVRSKPFFAGLQGAQGARAVGEQRPRDPRLDAPRETRVENPDGTITLRSANARHLMGHILTTLERGERELFVDQVLSQATRREYAARGRDPGEAFDTVLKNLDGVKLLFSRMPMGEFSPNVTLSKRGDRLYRVRLTRGAARGLKWEGFDMIMEGGEWRLLWFVG